MQKGLNVGHLQDVSQWLTDEKVVVECYDEAGEKKKQVIKWEIWNVSEGIALLGCICSCRKADSTFLSSGILDEKNLELCCKGST